MSCGCLKSLGNLIPKLGNKKKPGKKPSPGGSPSDSEPPTSGDGSGGKDTTTPPTQPGQPPSNDTPATIEVDIVNQTDGSQPVYAFITGSAINKNNEVVLIQSDGKTPYYPTNPSSTNADLGTNCAIALGGAGATTTCTIPQIAGGRIWFSIGSPLKFFLNPGPSGPALVEPSVTNPSDPSINITWDFCEFTYNAQQMFANISYVDFVSIPVALTLTNTSGAVQHVSGMDQNGLTTVVNGLTQQNAADGVGWNKLVVNGPNGQPLRALSPNSATVGSNNLFSTYFDSYIDQIWSKYSSEPLQIDTQVSYGIVSGTVQNGVLTFPGGATFSKPSTGDVFSCSTGPFAGSTQEELAITPRIAAGFNRSTLQLGKVEPDGVSSSQYYQQSPTNHYSRIVHGANLDKRGYAFPYDDVVPNNGNDVAGTVFDPNPTKLTISVGGHNATTTNG